MSDPNLSNIPSQSQTIEPAMLMVGQNVDFSANLSPQVRGIPDQHPIIVPYDADYEELKIRVLSNLM